MKKLVILSMFFAVTSSAFAADIFMNNNPFPQTSPQTMNNLYEAEPATIQQETKQEKKSWFRKGKNLQSQEAAEKARELQKYPVNEGSTDGSFYTFK